MTRLVIVGGGGHGRELLDIVEAAVDARPGAYEFVGFLDDGEVDAALLERRNARLIGTSEVLSSLDAAYAIGIGNPTIRARIDTRLRSIGEATDALRHPLASVASDNRLAPGVVLAAGARVTTNVHLGRHTHLNVNAVVSHDCRVGNYVTLSPGVLLNGNVQVGDRVFFGTGAIVVPGTIIGDDSVVGAGAVVTTDVAAGTTVGGVPARPLGQR